MGILEALKKDVEQTYEYKVGYQDGFMAGRDDSEDDIDLMLDEIEDTLESFAFEHTNRFTGSQVDCVEMKHVSKVIDRIKQRRKAEHEKN